MNWKRAIGWSAGVVGAAAVIFLAVRACDNSGVRNEILATRARVNEARAKLDSLAKQNQAYRDSVAMWRDSTAKVNEKLAECEKGSKPAQANPGKKPAPKKPAKPQDAKPKVIRDTVFVEKQAMPIIPEGNNTKITANDNEKNIVVQNEEGGKGSMTEINAENNQGNIVVNNGSGNVNIEKDPFVDIKVAYLEYKLDSLGREIAIVRDEKGNVIDSVVNAVSQGTYKEVIRRRVKFNKQR